MISPKDIDKRRQQDRDSWDRSARGRLPSLGQQTSWEAPWNNLAGEKVASVQYAQKKLAVFVYRKMTRSLLVTINKKNKWVNACVTLASKGEWPKPRDTLGTGGIAKVRMGEEMRYVEVVRTSPPPPPYTSCSEYEYGRELRIQMDQT